MRIPEFSNPKRSRGVLQFRNALVTRIALFLNYLSKKDFHNLLTDGKDLSISSEGELLKFMISKKYINPIHIQGLKTACLNFARVQEDNRFGALCIQFEFLTRINLNLVLNEQKRLIGNGHPIFLGDLLVGAGMLSECQKKLILHKQKMEQKLKRSASGFGPNTKTFQEKDIVIYVPEDGLNAFMVKTASFNPNLPLSALKRLIERNDIIYGIANDNSLNNFLKSKPAKGTPFELARGIAPVPGTDANIFYLFDRDYLTPGTITEYGAIDYKTRGEIPIVDPQMVIAEKKPAKPEKDGVNVFGDVVKAAVPKDTDIVHGDGVTLSDDKLTAYAAIKGYPELNRTGTLTVSEVHVIRGDVDYTTGHVKFDKNVHITGTINAGFKVEAQNVTAGAVDGGIIRAKGNVMVTNGITDASIKAEGGLIAGFVHRSTIACMGDVEIGNEVVESTLLLEGCFEMPRGKMFASSVSARGGAKIYHIGSVKALPSSIMVGISPHTTHALKCINKKLKECQVPFQNKTIERSRLENRLSDVNTALTRLAQTCRSKRGQKNHLNPTAYEIRDLQAKKQVLIRKINQVDHELNEIKKEIKQWGMEKLTLKQQNRTNPTRPFLDVQGQILSGTQIGGPHSTTILSQDLARVKLLEMFRPENREAGKTAWEMISTPL